MSGDVQPRKRKEKRRKKEDSEEIPTSYTSDEQLHVHKDASTGGNICAKILFFLLSFVLVVMIGLVLFEYRGVADDETLVPVSKWAATFEGWLEAPVKHDDHADITESGEQEHGESGEHESAEGEEHASEEAGSKEEDEEEDEDEEKGSEEEETKSVEEEEEEKQEEEEEEDENEEADKSEDEKSEEVDENEIYDQDEDEQEEEEEEESEEDVYGHGKSEEDLEADKEEDDDDAEEEEEEEEDVEAGREELDDDDDDDDEERETSAYQRDSNEIDDLNEIPGITESDEDEEGDNLGGSDEIIDELPKIPGVDVKKIKAVSEEEADVPRQKREKEVGGEFKSSKMSQDKAVEKEEEGEDEPEPSGVALKFGVGVALVIVAHVVLVKKWNSDDNLAAPNTSDASQSVPQVEQHQISKQIPQILVEPETVKDYEESSNLSSEYITRRQTLLPDDLVHSLPQRELEESESSVPSEEESDDGQEEFIFKQNVYKAENAFKASHRDEKPFSQEKPYKQPSFEELMKKYHESTPEGSDIETDEDEQEEEEEEEEEDDERDIDDDDDDELIDDDDDDENEEPEDIEEISEHKGQGSKISTTPETEGTSPRKFIVDTQKEQRIASVGQTSGNREEDEILAGENEDEEHEEEDTGELDSEDDSLGEKFKSYQLPKARKLQKREDDDDSGSEKEIPVTKSKIPKNMGGQNAQVYSKADITNEDDWHIIQDLDRANDDADENPEVAIHRYDTILKSHPNSPRAWYGKATALDQLAAKKKSNFILDQAIDAYKKVTSELINVPDELFTLAAERCIDRMRFRGVHARAVPIHKLLIARFPDDPAYQNQLAVTYLMINRNPEAKQVLENVLQKWPRNGFAQVHYGFILKTGNYNMTEAVRYLQEGIATREPGTIDGRFFFQLGDALMRLGRRNEAAEVNELGVREGLFLSKYQRSLYNVDRLRAQPWWTPDETTYAPYFRKLEENWKQIKEEGVKALYDKNKNLFRDEAENLKDSGKWKQLELFARGRKVQTNCEKAPVTCKLIEEFPAARDCRRGQVKFSVMDPGTHVWPHCGPTNCRLRAHLGLVVPKNTFIRVADETRTWEEGKLFIFDDSFEHEVWHNGTTTRLVLIVDVWHPELTVEERRSLPAI